MARWAALIYDKQADREAIVAEVVAALRRRAAVAGFVQRRRQEGDGAVIDLVRLARPEAVVLGRPRVQVPTPDGCSFAFDAGAFALGHLWLAQDAPAATVLVLDEISRLELLGKGHHAALAWALAQAAPKSPAVLFTARADRLSDVVTCYAPPGEPAAWLEHGAPGASAEGFAAALLGELTG